jgi:SAM-dependent methyltransferase
VPVVFLDQPDPKHPAYARDGERADRYEADLARWERYSPVRTPLRDLLDPFEWNAATRATLSAYYTPAALAQVMWEGLAAFGFDGGEVLEAGCGSGVFFGAAPDLPDLRLTGVELDPVTARIAALIYPDANVLAESFADTDAPAGGFDAAVGNVPFAQTPFTERRYGAAGHSLHNGFLIKQLALVREGGLVLAVTSRWTLDGEEATAARRQMAHFGDLLAAYRLPAGVFTETAGTDVVVDVLVLRRRAEGQAPTDPVWLGAPARDINGSTHTINAHFAAHPEHVLGQLTTEPGPYGPRPTVTGDPATALDSLR